MKTILRLFGVSLIILSFTACASGKKVLYFQDIEKSKSKLEATIPEFEPIIRKNDLLSIVAIGPNKEVIMPYNSTLSQNITVSGNASNATLPYLVDTDGYINYPTLGKIYVEGMTRQNLIKHLETEIAKDVKDPVVMVRFLNYRFTVLGDVNSPGTYTLTDERTTILQALGLASDLSITGKRKNVLIIREKEGKKVYAKFDLRKSDIFSSEYYYVMQNDVIYVQPNSTKVVSGNNSFTVFSFAFSILTLAMTVAAIVINNK